MIRDVIKRVPLARSAVHALRNARRALQRSPKPAILMYHRISEDRFDPWGLVVPPTQFASHLRWLSEYRTVLPLADFAARHREGALPRRAVAVTFDDGYACAAEVAAPLLHKFRTPATIFLPAELIERGEQFWWDELESLVLDSAAETLRFDGQLIRLGDRRPDDREWAPGAVPGTPRQSAFHQIWAGLRSRTPATLDECMAKLRSTAGTTENTGSARPMSPKQVRDTAADGLIDFGSHALTHPPLPKLSANEKARQIEGSIERCAALSGTVPRTFAYPYGDFDSESERLVEAAGFDCACTTRQRMVTASARLFALPRIAVGNWDSIGLARALGGIGRQGDL